MQAADKGTAADLAGEGLRIGIVRARFNEAITSKLAEACLAGRIRPEAGMRFPLERIVEAFDAVASRRGLGRVLVDVAPRDAR